MTRYFFPFHLDGGNRGCEGIAKGTAKILNCKSENLLAYCQDITLDDRLGLSSYVRLIQKKDINLINKIFRKVELLLANTIYQKRYTHAKYSYNELFAQMKNGDIMLSTGGDMLCYDQNDVTLTNNYVAKKGYKTVLWGCSMGEENLTEEKRASLKNFSLIYARESLSYEFFKSLGLKNVICYPDPAFVLDPEPVDLPSCLKNNSVIGLNLSNYVTGGFNLDSKFGKEIKVLINHILNDTNFHILLIPHVMWNGQDDRIISNYTFELYRNTGRVHIFESDKYNYLQIRYVISKCHSFIGARTHAVISAYSTCTPTIALGYSIKSKGIAKDLGLSEKLVVESSSKNSKYGLIESFEYMLRNYDGIKEHLCSVIPEYRIKPYTVLEHIKKIFNYD